MNAASILLPARMRDTAPKTSAKPPSWYSRQVSPLLQALSGRSCSHPIHTIVFIALFASAAYLTLLESNLFDAASPSISNGRADYKSLISGSRRVTVSKETEWKWLVEDHSIDESQSKSYADDLALLTFVFPDSSSSYSSYSAPPAQDVHIPSNLTVEILPSSTNVLSPISYDTSLAFSLPLKEASSFLRSVQEIPVPEHAADTEETAEFPEQRKWIMKAARASNGGSRGPRVWVTNAWTNFVDLIKSAESLDIVIMTLGYLSMHLTIISLFLSMRRLGSFSWLAIAVMFQSFFSLFFAIAMTMAMGVPMNIVLLSEGLPFLVVTIGFEKPVALTKAVLSASLNSKRAARHNDAGSDSSDSSDTVSPTIQSAVLEGVRMRGADIVRDYLIEILILVAGAASGVQGGLKQFCFLAAWIMIADCILLFTFYTAILTIKLEINRIKRHVFVRRALVEDGMSRKVAEEVASSNDWPQLAENGKGLHGESTIFGRKFRSSSVPKFKILMVGSFVLINIINLATMPFRDGLRSNPASAGLSSVVSQPPMDPFKVAGSGLESICSSAKKRGIPVSVTVFSPIKYELQYPSVHYSLHEQAADAGSINYADLIVGGRIVESLLRSFEDPVLSKWVIAALALSLVLNGYLFNAARWTLKEPGQPGTFEVPLKQANGSIETKARSPSPVAVRQPAPAPTPITDTSNSVDHGMNGSADSHRKAKDSNQRTPAECEEILRLKRAPELTDRELIELSLRGKIPGYALEKTLGDKTRAVKIRRSVISRTPNTIDNSSLLERSKLPCEYYDYDRVFGACCENVIGYMPLPVGVAGPMIVDGKSYFLPMATTEGVLVASTSRGCKAINSGGGATTVLTGDGMTRGPCISFANLTRAGAAKLWLDSEEGQRVMKTAFNSTSRFARLQSMKTAIAGSNLYIRFKTTTGDAMGMNMISKGVEHALSVMASDEFGFDDMQIVSVSGNYCIDKKSAAINWIDGRGKSVVAEAIIPADVVKSVLKTDVDSLVSLNVSKNLIGSAMAGAMGGFNAHAGNIVAAMFLATGQDPAQVTESSNCITTMNKTPSGALQIAVSLPSIEVGTIGGGTVLEPQSAMLDLLGVRGAHPTTPGSNAQHLARIIAAAVLAGELSLNSALAAGHLVRAHMAHNRSVDVSRAGTPAPNPRELPAALDKAISNGLSVPSSGAPSSSGVATPVSAAVSGIRERAAREGLGGLSAAR